MGGRKPGIVCKRGHVFNETNTYYSHGRQHCRRCASIRERTYREKKKNGKTNERFISAGVQETTVLTDCVSNRIWD